VTQTEGNSGGTAFNFTVTRSGDTSAGASVNYAVVSPGFFPGSPANAADFQGGVLPNGTLNFAAGETSRLITIFAQGDTDVEPDEMFSLLLSSPTGGATIGSNFAGGRILTDEGASITLSGAPLSTLEGNAGSTPFTFTATRSGDLTIAASATWTVTGSGGPFFGAVATDDDFTGGLLPSGIVSFAVGETSKTFTVNVQGDTAVEPNEGFTVHLSNPSAGAYVSLGGFGTTIFGDDGAVIAFSNGPSPSILEGDSGSTPMVFNVTRSGDTSLAVSANWQINPFFFPDANAANAADFLEGISPRGR